METNQNCINEVFSLFDRAETKEPFGTLSITDFASIVCEPEKGGAMFIEAAKNVEKIRSTDNQEEQRRLKLTLPAIAPGVKFKNNRQNIESLSGLMQIDIDKGIENPEFLRNRIGREKWVLLSALSVRRGVWFLTRVPEPEKQPEYWEKINEWLKKNLNIEADISRKNPKDLRFYAPDSGVIFNPGALTLNKIQRNSNTTTTAAYIQRTKKLTGYYVSSIDDFKRNADVIPILLELGWKKGPQHGKKTKFTRPGKDKGTSAEWDEEKRLFYIFSSSSSLYDLNPGRSLSAVDLYTQLKQIGIKEAVAQLKNEGWGIYPKTT